MSKRLIDQLRDALVALLLSVAIAAYFKAYPITGWVDLSLIPLIWLGLRHGAALSVLTGALVGLCTAVFVEGGLSLVGVVIGGVLPYALVGSAGLFAKYTQKTLNNRKLASTYLNICTASLLAVFAYYISKDVLYPLALGHAVKADFVWGALITYAISFVLLFIVARIKAGWLIPKRSKYLSRKETSKLLND